MSEGHDPQGYSTRLNVLEREAAATRSDIRGIYSGLDEIRAVLVRIQEGSKPNLNAMFIAILAACSIMITIGGLAIAPINQTIDKIYDDQQRLSKIQQDMMMTRFTGAQGHAMTLSLSQLGSRVAYLEGKNDE